MNFYRRERDFYIIISLVWYGLNIAEAATSAHLLNFDVSEDLSIYLEPYLNNSNRNLQGGISLYLRTNRLELVLKNFSANPVRLLKLDR